MVFNEKGHNRGGPVRAQGNLGEQAVQRLLGGWRSPDPFDQNQDMTDQDGRSVEVKTQYRYRIEGRDIFSVKWASPIDPGRTNFEKCLKADRLIFVEYRPVVFGDWPGAGPYRAEFHDVVHIWECIDRKTDAKRYRANVWKYAWPIDLMSLLWVGTCPKLSAALRKYSIAGNSLN